MKIVANLFFLLLIASTALCGRQRFTRSSICELHGGECSPEETCSSENMIMIMMKSTLRVIVCGAGKICCRA